MPLHSSAAARLASVLSALKGLGVRDRDTHLRVLRETLDNHSHHLGAWAVWEPDALDGNDLAFKQSSGHDQTGRFKPWWHRRFGTPAFEVCQDCEDPILGGYYQQPILKRAPVAVAPYRYPIGDDMALLATISAPIFLGDRCIGAAGVDYALDTLAQRVAEQADPGALELMNQVARELDVGLVFLDPRQRVIACSASADEMMRHCLSAALVRGQMFPGELRPVEAPAPTAAHETVFTQRGVTLKSACASRVTGEISVIVLTKLMAALELPPLSAREDEVMSWLAEGKSNEEIGIILSISPHTVKNHLDRIYRKIGVDNRHAATLAWSRAKALTGVIPTPM